MNLESGEHGKTQEKVSPHSLLLQTAFCSQTSFRLGSQEEDFAEESGIVMTGFLVDSWEISIGAPQPILRHSLLCNFADSFWSYRLTVSLNE